MIGVSTLDWIDSMKAGKTQPRPSRPSPARTRADAQAQTRELVLQAAEKLFLAKGLHATTVAEIATAAGRTQGSIYGNFSSKEELCAAVLERRYERIFADLATRLADGADTLAEKLEVVTQWWRANTSDDALSLLVAESAVAARRNPERQPTLAAAFTLVENAFGSIFAEHFGPAAANANGLVDTATRAVLSTGMGLAVVQTLAAPDADVAPTVLSETFRLWAGRLEAANSAAQSPAVDA